MHLEVIIWIKLGTEGVIIWIKLIFLIIDVYGELYCGCNLKSCVGEVVFFF
jgi:hypothetical protein